MILLGVNNFQIVFEIFILSNFPSAAARKYKKTPSSGQLVISVPRKDDQPTREATLTVSYASFTVLAPNHRPKTATRQEITLNVIAAREENPPAGSTPINWLLLTSLEVKNFEQAIRCIRWYTYTPSG